MHFWRKRGEMRLGKGKETVQICKQVDYCFGQWRLVPPETCFRVILLGASNGRNPLTSISVVWESKGDSGSWDEMLFLGWQLSTKIIDQLRWVRWCELLTAGFCFVFCFFKHFWPHHPACRTIASRSGIEHTSPALELMGQQLLSATSSSHHRWVQDPGWSNQMPSSWNFEKSNIGAGKWQVCSSSCWDPKEISPQFLILWHPEWFQFTLFLVVQFFLHFSEILHTSFH